MHIDTYLITCQNVMEQNMSTSEYISHNMSTHNTKLYIYSKIHHLKICLHQQSNQKQNIAAPDTTTSKQNSIQAS